MNLCLISYLVQILHFKFVILLKYIYSCFLWELISELNQKILWFTSKICSVIIVCSYCGTFNFVEIFLNYHKRFKRTILFDICLIKYIDAKNNLIHTTKHFYQFYNPGLRIPGRLPDCNISFFFFGISLSLVSCPWVQISMAIPGFQAGIFEAVTLVTTTQEIGKIILQHIKYNVYLCQLLQLLRKDIVISMTFSSRNYRWFTFARNLKKLPYVGILVSKIFKQ